MVLRKGYEALELFELLEIAKRTGDIICSKGNGMSMRYRNESESFVWCNIKGKFYTYEGDNTGYNQVVLKPSLFKHEWYLQPYKEEFNGRMILDKDGLWFEDEEGNLLRFNDFKIKC